MHPTLELFGVALPRMEQGVDAVVLLVLLASGLVVARQEAGRAWKDGPRTAMATLACALLVLGLRLALFPPSFVHANLHGPALVDDDLAEPYAAMGRGSGYGQATFLVLGLIARLVGPRFETIAWTNAVVGVASLVVTGLLAARWTGRSACAPLAVLAGGLQPALARVACSEDAHGLAGLFGLLALLAIDLHAVRRHRAALVLAVSATALMVESRQTFYPWTLCVVAVALARGGGWVALRRVDLLTACLCIALALVARLATTMTTEPSQVAILPAALASPRLLWAIVRHHPCLDLGRFALGTLPLGVLGVVAMRTAPMGRAFLGLLAFAFLFTAPFGFPVPGVECAFRLPVLLLANVAVASGAERLWRAGVAGRGALAAAVCAPLVLPSWAQLREPGPLVREYLFVRDVAATVLAPGSTLAEIPPVDPAPAYHLAQTALRPDRARRVSVAALTEADFARGPVYFLAGVQCRARSGLEVTGVDRKVETLSIGELRDMALPAFEHDAASTGAPSTLRDDCARLLRDADPVGPDLVIDAPPPEVPFVLYGDAPLHVRFWRLRGPVEATLTSPP